MEPSPAAPAPAPDASGTEALGPFVVRAYRIKPKKLWAGLLETLAEAGYPPEETDAKARTVKTSFVDFRRDEEGPDIAAPPPRLGANYHIMQMIKVIAGKVSLEAAISGRDRGAELRVRARILGLGLDRRRNVQILVDRKSVGVFESEFLARLEQRLGLEPL